MTLLALPKLFWQHLEFPGPPSGLTKIVVGRASSPAPLTADRYWALILQFQGDIQSCGRMGQSADADTIHAGFGDGANGFQGYAAARFEKDFGMGSISLFHRLLQLLR